jgi:hypothetical protein
MLFTVSAECFIEVSAAFSDAAVSAEPELLPWLLHATHPMAPNNKIM